MLLARSQPWWHKCACAPAPNGVMGGGGTSRTHTHTDRQGENFLPPKAQTPCGRKTSTLPFGSAGETTTPSSCPTHTLLQKGHGGGGLKAPTPLSTLWCVSSQLRKSCRWGSSGTVAQCWLGECYPEVQEYRQVVHVH